MDKKKHKASHVLAHVRGWIQAVATILTNIHLPNFFKGEIYRGNAKTVCVPGLNCYSCPAAAGACPIGAFQAVVGSSKFKFSYYITGFLILAGVLLGRFVCGFLCPFGWFQELLHKIPFKKISTRKLKPLRFIKYGILLVFVILLPILVTNQLGMGDPFFLQIPLSTGSIRGGTSTFDCKCRHPCGIGKAVYMEGRNTGCGRVVKPYVLSPILQMDLSAWRSLCAF